MEINNNISEVNETSQNESIIESISQTDESENTPKRKRLSKKEKKLNRYQQLVANYKMKKQEKKKQKAIKQETAETNEPNDDDCSNLDSIKQPLYDSYINKRELKKQTLERMKKVFDTNGENTLKICIDCSFSELMSDKEMSRLAQQIGRCYASNKTFNQPVYLTLCNLNTETKFYKECCRVNDGFSRYILNTTDKSIIDYYSESLDTIAYLSPDSPNLLETIDAQTTYVIGGLVDETVKKVTFTKCSKLNLKTYSLPIEKYMTRRETSTNTDGKTFNYNKILAINQVFDILANYFITNDWCKSLEIGVPKRKGFTINSNLKKEDDSSLDSSNE